MEIEYIAIVTSQVANSYCVGGEGVTKIKAGEYFVQGDPFDCFFVYKGDQVFARLSAILPLEIRYFTK